MADQEIEDLDAITNVVEIQSKQRKALDVLLENQRNRARHHLVLQVQMGGVKSYVASVSLDWVANNIGFTADLPIFKEAEEGSKRIEIDRETIENIQQRKPDWSRQLQMTSYLATQRYHKFPPLLIVGYQSWVYDERHARWGIDGRAEIDSVTKSSLNAGGTYWDLDDSNTRFYALDGQHRLMAILGLKELLQSGHLHALDKQRKTKNVGGLSREQMVQYITERTDESAVDVHERLEHLMEENIGVEIVPAVCAGETYKEALRRLRQIFVDVNEHAKSLSKSELTQLDERNGFRVVSRRLVARHPLLHDEEQNRPMVEMTTSTLSKRSECYTTLNTLVEITQRFLTQNKALTDVKNFQSWANFPARGIYVRPDDVSIEKGEATMIEYFNEISKIPSHKACMEGTSFGELREKEENILFRPMVQMALATALGNLLSRGEVMEDIVDELSKQELNGQLMLRERTAPWFGVLCDSDGNMRRHRVNSELCCQLFEYLLGGGKDDDTDRERLREAFAEQRTIDKDNEQAIDLDGKSVHPREVRLPLPWR